jgi:hypothetical protein
VIIRFVLVELLTITYDITGGIQALSVLNSVGMEIADQENCIELMEAALSQILTWKEDNDLV